MIEGELHVTGQRLGHRGPGGTGRVSAGNRFGEPRGDGQVGRRHDPPSGVTIRRTVDTKLFEVQLVRPQARFLGKLAMGGRHEVFFLMTEEAAGKGQGTLMRLNPTLNQQHLQAGIPQGEDDEVDREEDGRWNPMIVGHGSTIDLLSP